MRIKFIRALPLQVARSPPHIRGSEDITWKKSEDGSDNKVHSIVKNEKSEDPRTITI